MITLNMYLLRFHRRFNTEAFEHIFKDASNKLVPVIFVLTGLLFD